MTCRAHVGVCARCYGSNMSNGECVKVGESVGIIAAESIGEPGTCLLYTSLRQPQVQRTDGVVAQARELEHRNADADDDDARNHAKDAPQGDFLAEKIHVQNAFQFLIRILYSTIP